MSSNGLKPFAAIPAPPPDQGGWKANALRFTRDPLPYMDDLLQNYGQVSALVQGGNEGIMFPGQGCPGTVFAYGSDLNRQILTQTDIFHSGPIIGPIYGTWQDDPRRAVLRRVGTGLFSLNGEEHQRQRRLIQPAFHRKRIDTYLDTMVQIAEQTVSQWHPGQYLDFQREMFQHTLTVAGRLLFGQDFSASADHLGNVIQRWLELIPLVSIEASPEDTEAFLSLSEQIDDQIRDLISWKRTHSETQTDVLAELIHTRDEDGGSLSEDELIGHINILLTAGHETTANALSWTVFLLSQHPHVMNELYSELQSVCRGSVPTLDQLGQLQVLDRVIKESMRLLPPVTIGSRVTAVATELGDFEIPVGTEIVFSHYHTHHDQAIYEQPSRYIPDRWLGISPTPYQYLPFSAGAKMCIGSPFALLEIKATLAVMLQRFRFKLQEEAQIDRFVWVPLRPAHMPFMLCAQDGNFEASKSIVRGNIVEMVEFV